MLLCLASAGMAMVRPTYACGLCPIMLVCLARAGVAIIGPTFAGGRCALMLLCLASAGMAIIGPADAGTTYDGLHRAIGLVPWATNTAFGPST